MKTATLEKVIEFCAVRGDPSISCILISFLVHIMWCDLVVWMSNIISNPVRVISVFSLQSMDSLVTYEHSKEIDIYINRSVY